MIHYSVCVLALLLAAWASMVPGMPQAAPRTFQDPRIKGNDLLVDAQVGRVLLDAPRGARLISTSPVLLPLLERLADNATLIRPNLVDTFRCDGKGYGYYADQDNECQVFHVCLPLDQLYPDNFTSPIVYQFSFICPEYTIFSQDAMVCAWSTEAVPCEYAHDLYWMNQNFFRKVPSEDGYGERYAEVNEALPETASTQ